MPAICVPLVWLFCGCQEFVNDADREVYRLIEQRQREALGDPRPARIDAERVPATVPADAYAFVPHPQDQARAPVLPAHTPAPTPPTEGAGGATRPTPVPSIATATGPGGTADVPWLAAAAATSPASAADGVASAPAADGPPGILEPTAGEQAAAEALLATPTGRGAPQLSLEAALAYAFRHGRSFQAAKETLYLAALDLTLERHMWEPRFFGNISSQYVNYGQIRDFDQAMDAVARMGIRQKLPYGGEVTAQVISTFMRDLTNEVTTAEAADIVLRADIPLLRGAGPAAYESRYQAERELIYAVRTFEQFRRSYAVEVAAAYFDLQQLRQQVDTARDSAASFGRMVERARALWSVGRVIPLEVQRAQQERLTAINSYTDAIEAYQTALDNFKLLIGMPTDQPLDVQPQTDPGRAEPAAGGDTPGDEARREPLAAGLGMPDISEEEAIRIALKYRLDLINDLDRVADAARGVRVAENNLLPDLAAFGSVITDTDANQLGYTDFNSERVTWRTGVNLELPLDRKAERNAYRQSLVLRRQAERRYAEAQDRVRLQVRRAMRRVQQQMQSLAVQQRNRELAMRRLELARYLVNKGSQSNREVIEAQNALNSARNRLAQAEARARTAVLEFLRDTGMLRIADDGTWTLPVAETRPAR